MKGCLFFLICMISMLGANAQQERLTPTSLKECDPFLVKKLLPGDYEFGLLKEQNIFRIVDGWIYRDTGLSFRYRTMKLTLRTLMDSRTSDEKKVDVKELTLTKEQADALYSLFTAAVCSSSYLDDCLVLDGDMHTFVAYPYAAHVNPAIEGSNGDKMREIASMLYKSIETKDASLIDKNMPEIKELTDKFIALYPCKPTSCDVMLMRHQRNQVKGKSMGLDF